MPLHKLVASGRSDVSADEIVLAEERDEVTGELRRTAISRFEAREIPEGLLESAHRLAAKTGMRVVEIEVAEGEAESRQVQQEPGADTAGAAPAVRQTGTSSSAIDQEQARGRAVAQGESVPGTPATSGTATTTPPPTTT